EMLVARPITGRARGPSYRAGWKWPRSTCVLGPLCLRNELLIRVLDLFGRRGILTFTRKEPRVDHDDLVEIERNRRLVDRRHGALFIIRSLHTEARHHIAVRAYVRFSDIFLRRLRRPTPRTRLFLDRVSLAGVGLAIARIFDPFESARWDSEEVRRPLTQETLLEAVAERALSFPNG